MWGSWAGWWCGALAASALLLLVLAQRCRRRKSSRHTLTVHIIRDALPPRPLQPPRVTHPYFPFPVTPLPPRRTLATLAGAPADEPQNIPPQIVVVQNSTQNTIAHNSGQNPQPSSSNPNPQQEYKGIPKLPLPEQWLHKRPIEYKYSITIPRPLAQIVSADLGTDLSQELRAKKYSATRSPSLEKDEKSPFVVTSAKSDKVFGFDTDVLKKLSDSGETSERMDSDEQEASTGNLRRFKSVSTRLNICSVNEGSAFESQHERLEMQNSPRVLECSSAKEKSSTSKFDFSPKKLADSISSPRFFTPPETVSPMFFAEPSPKSVYYDTVKSPKFFPETPRDNEVPQSPRKLADNLNRNGLNEKPSSPKILATRISPKVHSYNKENYFSFDQSCTIADVARMSPRPRKYTGRNSIEKERFTPPVDKDIRKYRRHNSCDTNYRTIELNITNDNRDIKDKDVVDCCAKINTLQIENKTEEKSNELIPNPTNTAQARRQRLKSISLDSDNAKIIEQNLGLPIAKQMKDQMNEAYKNQEVSTSCECVDRFPKTPSDERPIFKFDVDKEPEEGKSPVKQKKSLRQSSDTQSFLDMPRFSPKEFEISVITDEATALTETQSKPKSKNLRNLTIDLTKRDSDLEKELVEFEKLYTDAEEIKVKTPISKIKASSLDSSESVNLSLPQKNILEVPQNSISVPNTPKRQLKRILQKTLKNDVGGAKFGCNSIQSTADQRRLLTKAQDSGIYLRENHASLMLYQPSTSRLTARTMRSFDENMTDLAENTPEINVSGVDKRLLADTGQSLGSNLLNYKQNLSVSSTNLKTLPEGVPSDDFEPSLEDEKTIKKLYRRNSNQSLMLSSHSLQGSNSSLNSAGASYHNLATVRTSISNFSLSSDRLKKLSIEKRDSNVSLTNADHVTPATRVICSSNLNLSGDISKNCLLQRRGSNNSLTLNIHSSNNLSRHSSNSSLNKEAKPGQKKGLLERRSSNTSLTLNINTSNPQLSGNKGLSISNYNLNGSACNLSIYNSSHSINTEQKKGILERRSSNTSLTLNIQPQEPRDLEIDEAVLENNLKELPHRDKHRKSLSTENLLPKSYKNRSRARNTEQGFGSHDNLWSSSYVEEGYQQNYGVTYVYGDQEDELVYAVARQDDPNFTGFVKNISTKPLSPQTFSKDFKQYLVNMQHLQNASSVLTRSQLRDLNEVFQNGYSKVKCHSTSDVQHCCSGRVEELSKDNPQMVIPEPVASQPCSEYQKKLLRNLHQEFWDMPLNFQEKPIVPGSHSKNRYKEILPNEHSRFILKTYDGTKEGYINANFIKGHEYSKNTYIATQGPLQNTIYDFWLMVYQNGTDYRSKQSRDLGPFSPTGIQKVVMLTNFIENNQQKCEKYFPMKLDEEVIVKNPNGAEESKFFVKNCGMVKKPGYTIRKLDVRFLKVEVEKSRGKHHDQTEFKTLEGADRSEKSNMDLVSTLEAEDTESLDGELFELRDKRVKELNQTHDRRLSETKTDTYPNYMTLDKVNNKIRQIIFNYELIGRSRSALQDDINRDCVRKCDFLFVGNVNPNVISVSCQTVDSDIEKCNVVDETDYLGHSDSAKCQAGEEDKVDNSQIDKFSSETNGRIVNENFGSLRNSSTQTERGYDVIMNQSGHESVFVVYHYWFHNWVDHKCPKDVNALLNLSLDVLKTGTCDFDQISDNSEEMCTCESPKCDSKFVFPPIDSIVPCEVKVNLTSPLDFTVDVPSPPTIVHCSAGIGRTGCLIAILNGIKQLTNDQKVDVLAIVCNMRLNRGGMVQNSEQYELIHKVLCLYEQACLPEL